MNSFEQHGFETPSFEGKIYEEVEGTYIGYAKAKHGVIPMCWFKNGSIFASNTNFPLTPIKKAWYEYPENFPALCITVEGHIYSILNKEDFLSAQEVGVRLATKAERDLLYVAEED